MPYTYGNRLSNIFGEGGADRLSGILGSVDQATLDPFNRGSQAWGMSDLAGLTRSGLFSGGDLDFLSGLRQADRAAGQKPWQVAGQTDPHSVARGGGARKAIKRANRAERRANSAPPPPPGPTYNADPPFAGRQETYTPGMHPTADPNRVHPLGGKNLGGKL